MTMSASEITQFIISELVEITGRPAEDFSGATALIGPDSGVTSRDLVELLLAVEEFAEDRLGVEFDWTSDATLSTERSNFRSIDALADHLRTLPVSTAA